MSIVHDYKSIARRLHELKSTRSQPDQAGEGLREPTNLARSVARIFLEHRARRVNNGGSIMPRSAPIADLSEPKAGGYELWPMNVFFGRPADIEPDRSDWPVSGPDATQPDLVPPPPARGGGR